MQVWQIRRPAGLLVRFEGGGGAGVCWCVGRFVCDWACATGEGDESLSQAEHNNGDRERSSRQKTEKHEIWLKTTCVAWFGSGGGGGRVKWKAGCWRRRGKPGVGISSSVVNGRKRTAGLGLYARNPSVDAVCRCVLYVLRLLYVFVRVRCFAWTLAVPGGWGWANQEFRLSTLHPTSERLLRSLTLTAFALFCLHVLGCCAGADTTSRGRLRIRNRNRNHNHARQQWERNALPRVPRVPVSRIAKVMGGRGTPGVGRYEVLSMLGCYPPAGQECPDFGVMISDPQSPWRSSLLPCLVHSQLGQSGVAGGCRPAGRGGR